MTSSSTPPPSGEMLSIVVPVFNEERSVRAIVSRLLAVRFPIPFEVIAVDDGSTDRSAALLDELMREHPGVLRACYSGRNVGKGAALRIGFAQARGTILTVQDADEEYRPEEFVDLLSPILARQADVVYGSRYKGGLNRVGFLNRVGNGFLSLVTSLLYGRWITDMETCYKVFRRSVLDSIVLSSTGFEIEPELTVKFIRAGHRIVELPIHYDPRTKQGGKKIRYFKDGWIALSWLVALRVSRGGAGPWPIERLLAGLVVKGPDGVLVPSAAPAPGDPRA